MKKSCRTSDHGARNYAARKKFSFRTLFSFGDSQATARLAIIASVLLLFFPLFVLTHTRIDQYLEGYSIARLKKEQANLLRELDALKLENALLRRPERIVKLAREKLGMIRPALAQIEHGGSH